MPSIRFSAVALLAGFPAALSAQGSGSVAGRQGSANIHVVSHLPLNGVSDIEVEHELSRPYAYVSSGGRGGFHIISLKNTGRPAALYEWRIENPELHRGGALGPVTLKSKGRYYFVQSFQYLMSGPDQELGAVVFDVTGLPDTSKEGRGNTNTYGTSST